MSFALSTFLALQSGPALSDEAADLYIELQAWHPYRKAKSPPLISRSVYRSALAGTPEKGIEYTEGVDAGKGWGVVVFALPVEQVWRAVSDGEHQDGYLSITESRFLAGEPGNRILLQAIDLPLVSDRWWIVRQGYNFDLYVRSDQRVWELYWTDVLSDSALLAELGTPEDGIPIAWTSGSWYLIDLGDDRTLVEYHVWTDPGGRLPVSAATLFAASAVMDTLEAIETMAGEHNCSATSARPDGTAL